MKILNLNLTLISLAFFACLSSCHKNTQTAKDHKNKDNRVQQNNETKEPVLVIEDKTTVKEEYLDYVEAEEEYIEEIQVAPALHSMRMVKNSEMKMVGYDFHYEEPDNTESYASIQENDFKAVTDHPLSTFSIDVDAASYTNTRRHINQGNLPPGDAVRIEEFINYFSYDYPQPKGDDPFSISTEVGACPWNTGHQLVHVGLQGKRIPFEEIDNINLVFLVDVSGSMTASNKLPLLKKSLIALTKQLRERDRVAIVVYAGAAGVVLPSTPGNDKQTIINSLNKLQSGGSTAGGAGIKLAYKIAEENLIKDGINRIILATDGDFNIGASSDDEMTKLIEAKRDLGISITNLGFGMGNYKDSKMETIADHGNGNYFYIDSFNEARKVLVDELDGTLYTIAKDVKLQIEFNPEFVKGYRLVGYENRMLNKEDFNDDKKDAGELGAGHTVTALYEIIPAGSSETVGGVDVLKYQKSSDNRNGSSEMLTVKFRYKEPNDTVSKLIVRTLDSDVQKTLSNNFNFSSSVAQFGMILRGSKYKGSATYKSTELLGKMALGDDENGYRNEFVKLVRSAALIDDMVEGLK